MASRALIDKGTFTDDEIALPPADTTTATVMSAARPA